MKITILLTKLSFTLSIGVCLCANVSAQNSLQLFDPDLAINSVIGDISFYETFGCSPDAATDEDLRISTHLAYVESLLRQRDASCLSFELQQSRKEALDLLHEYWKAGKFPRNYDIPGVRRPCFIDQDRTICAVGYLVEKTAGREVAERINKKYKYAFVAQMNDPLVDEWIAGSGLTKEECAIIQPDYCWFCPPACQGNKVWACRESNCELECKCVNANQVAHWQFNGAPCDTLDGNGNGNGNGSGNGGYGNGNGNGNGYSISQDEIPVLSSNSYLLQSDLSGDMLAVYPNPLTDYATISIYLPQEDKPVIQVYDLQGRIVTKLTHDEVIKGNHQWNLNTSDYPAGIYLVNLILSQTMITSKITVTK